MVLGLLWLTRTDAGPQETAGGWRSGTRTLILPSPLADTRIFSFSCRRVRGTGVVTLTSA